MQETAKLQTFPKEFEKDYLRSADWKFFTLVVISILLHTLSILYLFNHYPNRNNAVFLKNARKQFAKKMFPLTNRDTKALNRLQQLYRRPEHKTVAGVAYFSPIQFVKIEHTKAAKVPQRSKTSEKAGQKLKMKPVKNISQIGLLSIINAKSGAVEAELQDFYDALDSTSLNVSQKLTRFRSFEAPQAGIAYSEKQPIAKPLQFYSERSYRAKKKQSVAADIQPKLPGETVQHFKNILREHNPAIQETYRRYLIETPDLAGKLIIRFGLNQEGAVTFASVLQSTTGSPEFDSEILTIIRQWKDFGKTHLQTAEIILRHTYVFK